MLNNSLPQFVAEMKEMQDILQAEQIEIDTLETVLQDIAQQFYIQSATYSLDEWEAEFGLERNPGLTQAQRRGRVLAKLNTTTPATISMLENLVQQVLGTDRVTIIEYPAEYRFEVFVHSQYLVSNIAIADKAVYDARPAHLAYNFVNALVRQASSKICIGFVGMQGRETYAELQEYKIERDMIKESYIAVLSGLQKAFNGRLKE